METTGLLYGGPWVAERYAAIQKFFDLHSDQIISPVREIIGGAHRYSAADAYNSVYDLRRFRRRADQSWRDVDCLLTPTAGTIYRINTMLDDPLNLNTNLRSEERRVGKECSYHREQDHDNTREDNKD